MPPLADLIDRARADAGGGPASVDPDAAGACREPPAGPEAEVARVMQICNACRYCEGFCAVFPAMTRRLEFGKADAHYLSNLCHNCGACLYACQYAPPHEFAVNVPKAMAEVRLLTYQDYAWPAAMGRLYRRAGLTVAVALAAGLALFLVLAVARNGPLLHVPLAGNFYAIFPHNFLVLVFGAVFGFAVLALGMGARRFWREVAPAREIAPAPAMGPGGGAAGARPADLRPWGLRPADVGAAAAGEATRDVLRLKYLDGGHGEGCNDEDDRFTLRRRRFHHFTFYGFLLCLASTSVATLYHYLWGQPAPYALTSLPVLLGTAGGIGLIVGPVGLLDLSRRRNAEQGDPAQRPMDHGFIALLLLTSITGLALLACRDTRWMAILLAVHLGAVLALFLTLPYGKFAHGTYRSAALLKFAIEKRLPDRLRLGAD